MVLNVAEFENNVRTDVRRLQDSQETIIEILEYRRMIPLAN